MLIVGHRGAAALAPENTLASLRRAFDDGADAAEVDVRLCGDGTLVLMHDDTVDRTTDGTGRVADLSFEALARLDAARFTAMRGTGVAVPTFAQAWREAGGRLVLEIKGAWGTDEAVRAAEALAAALDGVAASEAIVSSFHLDALEQFRSRISNVRTGVLTFAASDAAANVEAAVAGGHEICFLPAAICDEAAIAAAHEAGRRAVAWTVDDPVRVAALRDWGADGLIADDPGAARAALATG